jgi:hypothetical protein
VYGYRGVPKLMKVLEVSQAEDEAEAKRVAQD